MRIYQYVFLEPDITPAIIGKFVMPDLIRYPVFSWIALTVAPDGLKRGTTCPAAVYPALSAGPE